MQQINLRKNRWAIMILCTVSVAIPSYAAWALTWPAVEAQRLGQSLPRGETWTGVLLVDGLLVLLAFMGCWGTLVQALTVIDADGIKRPSLLGALFVQWSQVICVKRHFHAIDIKSSVRNLQILPFLFKDRKALIAFLRDHVPKDAFHITEEEATIWK